jgi:hypothetical protein
MSYRSGVGEYQKYLNEQNFRREAMLFDAQQRQQAMQFQALQNSLDRFQQDKHAQTRMQMAAWQDQVGRQRELEDAARAREFALADRDALTKLRADESALDHDRRKELFGMESDRWAEREGARNEFDMSMARKQAAWEGVAKGTHAYNSSQLSEMDRLRGERQKWFMDPTIPDDVKQDKIAELDRLYAQIEENPDPLRPDEREPKIEDKVKNTTWRETMPNGAILVWGEEIRNGEKRTVVHERIDPEGNVTKYAQEDAKLRAQEQIAARKAMQDFINEQVKHAQLLATGEGKTISAEQLAQIMREARESYMKAFPEAFAPAQPVVQQGPPGVDEGSFFEEPQMAGQPSQPQTNSHQFSPTGLTPEEMQGVAGVQQPAPQLTPQRPAAQAPVAQQPDQAIAAKLAELRQQLGRELTLEEEVIAINAVNSGAAQPQAPSQGGMAPQRAPQQPVAQPPQPQQGFTPSPMHQLGQHYTSLPPDYNSLLATSGEIKTERDLIQQSSAAIQQLSPEDLAVVHANVASLPNSAQYGRLKEALLPLIQAEIQKRKANPPMQPGDVNLALKFGNAVPVSTPEGRQQVPIGGTYVAPDGTVRRRAN